MTPGAQSGAPGQRRRDFLAIAVGGVGAVCGRAPGSI
ncbi:ubiquinol-cytochrome c reductase iron-sulfur subunit N-terminal domain-containing protein [Pseudomonas fluorescens]